MTYSFDLVKLVVGIICVLALVGVIPISATLAVALILASQCEVSLKWSAR